MGNAGGCEFRCETAAWSIEIQYSKRYIVHWRWHEPGAVDQVKGTCAMTLLFPTSPQAFVVWALLQIGVTMLVGFPVAS
jgi:hypothetical protein